jgi:alpha-L-fucosidase
VNYVIKRHPDLWSKFCAFTRAQIEELMTGYGRIDILWLDGGWVRPLDSADFREARPDNGFQCAMQSQDIDMPGIAAMARSHQPGLIIVDRTVPGRYENYRTPEKQVPDAPLDYPWETCMTMANQWSYMPGDVYKSTRTLVHMLIDVAAKGGNFLLNVGPTPEGTLPDTALARMREIGEWMNVNSGAIYSTRPIAPYKDGRVCFTSGTEGSVYAIQLADDGSDTPPAQITFTAPFVKDIRSVALTGYEGKVRWTVDGCTMTVDVPEDFRSHPPCRHAWVVTMSGRR